MKSRQEKKTGNFIVNDKAVWKSFKKEGDLTYIENVEEDFTHRYLTNPMFSKAVEILMSSNNYNRTSFFQRQFVPESYYETNIRVREDRQLIKYEL